MEMMVGDGQSLVSALDLVGQEGIRQLEREEVTYVRLTFAQPVLLLVHGWALEAAGEHRVSEEAAVEADLFFSRQTVRC